MAIVYDILYTLFKDLGITISFEKMYGLDFFPKFTKDNVGNITIYENDKLYQLLLLYNRAIIDGSDLGITINRLNLLYSLLELNDYEGAYKISDKIIDEVNSKDDFLNTYDGYVADDWNREQFQHLFILLHELFHIIVANNHTLAAYYLNYAHTHINDILRLELDEFNLNIDELSSSEKFSSVINSIFQDSLDSEDNADIRTHYKDCIGQLKMFYDAVMEINASSNHYIVEEIACDLFAWEVISNLFCTQSNSTELIEISRISLTILYTMEFNENILSQFRPRKHAKYVYDGIRALIRQKCLRYALNKVAPSLGLKYYWKELDSNFIKVFNNSVKFIQIEDFTRAYRIHGEPMLTYNKQEEEIIMNKINTMFLPFTKNNRNESNSIYS